MATIVIAVCVLCSIYLSYAIIVETKKDIQERVNNRTYREMLKDVGHSFKPEEIEYIKQSWWIDKTPNQLKEIEELEEQWRI